MSINLFLISLHKKNLSFYYLFFNYSNYCYFTYFLTFVIEFFLILYILYYFIFYDEVCINFKKLFFQYLFFLCFLISILYFILLENTTIICFHLISTKYIIYCKFIIIIILLLTLLINYNKFMINPKEIGFKELPILLSFLLLFICILLASCDFFVIYLVIEGISLILYSLGSLMNKSLINLEAIIKYFLINNMASTCLL